VGSIQAASTLVEVALALGVGEEGDPLGSSAKDDALAGEARADRKRDREVRLVGAGWSEQDHVFLGGQEVELAEVLDDLLL